MYNTCKRYSIRVRSAVYQEGPKNPLKGITVKPLVLALNAQFGVGAGGKCELRSHQSNLRLLCTSNVEPFAYSGRPPMAWRIRPCLCGDLTLCGSVTATFVRIRIKPALRCVNGES